MIDWLKFRAPYQPVDSIGAGLVVSFGADGDVQWQKLKPQQVRGSYSSSVNAWRDSYTSELVIDGNPSKFFQGHNLFGSWDVVGLAARMFEEVCRLLKVSPGEQAVARMWAGDFELLRVDLTAMYATGSRARARAVLASLHDNAHMRYRGQGLMSKGTLYWSKHSRRWATKAYVKGDELEAGVKHSLPESAGDLSRLIEWADDKLRIEHVIRAMELKTRAMNRGDSWSPEVAQKMYDELFSRLHLPSMVDLPSATLDDLPARLRLTYQAWKRGEDIRLLCSRRSFYRYRAEMLKLGVDIAVPQPREPKSNVVPFVTRVELKPASVPSWALESCGGYFEPRQTA